MPKFKQTLQKHPAIALIISDILFIGAATLVFAGVKGLAPNAMVSSLAASAALMGSFWCGWQGAVGLIRRRQNPPPKE